MTPLQISIIVIGACNAAAAAILAVPDTALPLYGRLALAAISAASGFALAALNSFSDAGKPKAT